MKIVRVFVGAEMSLSEKYSGAEIRDRNGGFQDRHTGEKDRHLSRGHRHTESRDRNDRKKHRHVLDGDRNKTAGSCQKKKAGPRGPAFFFGVRRKR
ncbi:hypothetical protein [Alkalicoccus urumqiensis]|uniref:hypothetical protein n=1 Tax=Alkalicoccus urumqiensis TaxID=1548213 RepID=UPI001156E280|nr:hypothetical protein [Alkalicoccus urumqiensis]